MQQLELTELLAGQMEQRTVTWMSKGNHALQHLASLRWTLRSDHKRSTKPNWAPHMWPVYYTIVQEVAVADEFSLG